MPDNIVHLRFCREVARRLELDIDRDIYELGALGPDPYLFYHFYVPPFRNRVNRYSSVMHREHTGDFLIELAIRAKGKPAVFSYLAGFLCHYALDSGTHPYVNRKAKNKIAVHIAIEHKLDNMFGGEIHIPPFLPETLRDEIGGAITSIYGWRDAWDKLKKGRRDMVPFYRLVRDESGRLDRFASKTHTDLALLSYKSSSLDGMDLRGFYPLFRRAVDDAVTFISAAQRFVSGETDEAQLREVIGNRSYIEG